MDRTAADIRALVADAGRARPRAVFVGKTQVPTFLGPNDDVRGRYEILTRHTRPMVVGVGTSGVRWLGRTRVVAFADLRPGALGGALFYAGAPLVGAVLSLGPGPTVLVCQSPYEGAGSIVAARLLPRALRPAVLVEVHGDWRTATRLYGSSARRLMSPIADARWRHGRSGERIRFA